MLATTHVREQRLSADQAYRTRLESTKCLLEALTMFGIPKSFVDVGCGYGHLVKIASALMGAHTERECAGLDISVTDRVLPHQYTLEKYDLTVRLPTKREPLKYDMVLCLEVAEHLPASASDTLCDTLRRLTAGDGVLLFSAAVPDQGGSGHINEQPQEYWIEKLHRTGMVIDLDDTRRLRVNWGDIAPSAWWYGNNVLVFRTKLAHESVIVHSID